MLLKLMLITVVVLVILLSILGISLYFNKNRNPEIYTCNISQDPNSDYTCGCGAGYCQNFD